MLSSITVTNHLSEYGDVRLCCTVYLTKGIHDPENEVFLRQVCALLNSRGGILSMRNGDVDKNILPKHLDLWWSGMESNIATILTTDSICNFVDFTGNFDDDYFYLFVKSAEQFCTVDYCCRLPTDTATHEVSYKSAVRLCQQQGHCMSLELLPAIPKHFEYGRIEETLKQEGKQIQFKFVTSRRESHGPSLAHKVSHYSGKYLSAFANHEGGHIYFGIEDGTAGVYGEAINSEDERNIVNSLEQRIRSMIWVDTTFVPKRGIHWDVNFLPVFDSSLKEPRTVIIVSVCKVFGGVFTSVPESYIVRRQPEMSRQQYSVQRLNFNEWKRLLLNQTRDCPSLHSRFVKMPLLTPQCHLTFSLPNTLQSARAKVIKLTTGLNLHPKNILHCLNNPKLKQAIVQVLRVFAEEEHLVITLNSWGLSPPFLQSIKPQNVFICLAIFSSSFGIHIVSLLEGRGEGFFDNDAWYYTNEMAISLKQCLVDHGGCSTRLGIRIHLLDITSPTLVETFQDSIKVNIYPQTFRIREQVMDQILDALTIAIASYKPFSNSDKEEMDHYFLLTCDQLELLWTHQFTTDLWVHGPPGAGKTVAALEMVKEFRRRGNQEDQVLYVAENSLICSYIR